QFVATLVINDDGLGSPHRVTLRGNGIRATPPVDASPPPPQVIATPSAAPPPPPRQAAIRIEPPLLDFSQKPRASQPVHIGNEGDGPLRVDAIKLLGADADRFQVDKNACPEIAPGANCLIVVSYHPKIWGSKKASYTAELTVDHNAPNFSSPQTVAL